MTSTPVTILELRSSLDSDRPSGTILQFGQLALCAGSGDPGLYFLDTDNAVRKIGPTAYGTTPPNAIYIGASGNSVGEAWTDSSPRNYYKVWDGTTWIKVSAGFSDTATLASGAILASGALLASGAYLASGAIQASGAILASGALFANAAIQASGAILASGAIQSETSNLASGAVLASGALFSNTSTLASGAVYASGASSIATVVASGLPNPTAIESGVAYLQLESSGTYPSGLYIRAGSDWYFI
mgnify:CR=1 FL=1